VFPEHFDRCNFDYGAFVERVVRRWLMWKGVLVACAALAGLLVAWAGYVPLWLTGVLVAVLAIYLFVPQDSDRMWSLLRPIVRHEIARTVQPRTSSYLLLSFHSILPFAFIAKGGTTVAWGDRRRGKVMTELKMTLGMAMHDQLENLSSEDIIALKRACYGD